MFRGMQCGGRRELRACCSDPVGVPLSPTLTAPGVGVPPPGLLGGIPRGYRCPGSGQGLRWTSGSKRGGHYIRSRAAGDTHAPGHRREADGDELTGLCRQRAPGGGGEGERGGERRAGQGGRGGEGAKKNGCSIPPLVLSSLFHPTPPLPPPLRGPGTPWTMREPTPTSLRLAVWRYRCTRFWCTSPSSRRISTFTFDGDTPPGPPGQPPPPSPCLGGVGGWSARGALGGGDDGHCWE